jgi:hypothetical protein
MSTIVTADLHLAENSRDAYRFQFLEDTLPQFIEKYKATRVLVLGDLCEVKDSHRAPLVNRIVDGFAALAELVDVYILKGNHDYVAEDAPYYRFLRHLPRVHWIGEVTRLKLRGLGECLFLPHTKHMEDDWVDHMFDGADWFFCHQTFGGADLGQGFKVEGVAPPFTRNAKVISGDVHVPQKLGPVTYVGSPYAVDFGDRFQPRVLLLTEGQIPKTIPVPGPQKRLVVLTERHQQYPEDVETGDVVKVRIVLAHGSTTSRAEWREAAHAWADKAGVVLYTVEIVAPKAERLERTDPSRTRTDEQLVRAYATKMGKDKTTVAVGLKIVEETP